MNTWHVRSEGAPVRPRPALRLVKTQDLSRQDWLAVRRTGIGSSDAAAAVGLNPYQSQLALWMEKSGRSGLGTDPASSEEDSEAMGWGRLLEPLVAAQYARLTGRRVRRVNAVLQHPDHPWMLANLDREVVGDASVQILECKTAGLHGERLWRDGVPEYVQLQVMHQLAVTGKSVAEVAVLICGQTLRIHRIERDERLIEQLIALEHRFMEWVKTDTPPPADGSDSADRALRQLYPQDSGQTLDLRGDLVMEAVLSDLLAVRAQLDSVGSQEALLKQALQQRMGEASKLLLEGGTVTWKKARDSLVLDADRLSLEQPALAATYQVKKVGARRLLVHSAPRGSDPVAQV